MTPQPPAAAAPPADESGPGPAAAPTGHDAVAAAAEVKEPSPRVQRNALAFFMGDEPPPGRDHRIPLAVDFGTPEAPNFNQCLFRPLANEELVKCEQLAQVKREDGSIERIDPFTRWSYGFAYACLDPNLAPALAHRQQKLEQQIAQLPDGSDEHREAVAERARLNDTAGLVREVFRFQPGVLQNVAYKIEERSRLGEDAERSVREVEAGKG